MVSCCKVDMIIRNKKLTAIPACLVVSVASKNGQCVALGGIIVDNPTPFLVVFSKKCPTPT